MLEAVRYMDLGICVGSWNQIPVAMENPLYSVLWSPQGMCSCPSLLILETMDMGEHHRNNLSGAAGKGVSLTRNRNSWITESADTGVHLYSELARESDTPEELLPIPWQWAGVQGCNGSTPNHPLCLAAGPLVGRGDPGFDQQRPGQVQGQLSRCWPTHGGEALAHLSRPVLAMTMGLDACQ